ncbi:NAD-dependent epimerase/dehydratase family protein [Methylosarcina fibrata]|uniref:NAD-dependent epimerase/dehydratase family protein n=1 Tax=Methylosarcina fibrata TaxID=105972 RepID=UPI001E5750DA|nr:NAD-dependent epimerase/dehydratase family protein [Methylosarcina fibrata]
MIVAITGGTGFIGRHLVRRHLALGNEVRYLTRQEPRSELNGAVPFAGHLNSSAASLREFLSGAEVVYHCAAELREEGLMHSTNVEGTANLLEAARGEVKRWVQLSSTGVYGNPRHKDIREDSAIGPVNAYEKSKTAADELISAEAAKSKMEFVILRPSNVYGTDMPNQSLFQMIRMIDKGLFFYIGKIGAIANYIHVENVVDALLLCARASLPANGRIYIVSDHCRLEEFVATVAAALHQPAARVRLPEGLIRRLAAIGSSLGKNPLTQSRIDALTNTTVYRSDRIRSELGYSHRIPMQDGIAELARFWKNGVYSSAESTER